MELEIRRVWGAWEGAAVGRRLSPFKNSVINICKVLFWVKKLVLLCKGEIKG
jgi:hypothetical protein